MGVLGSMPPEFQEKSSKINVVGTVDWLGIAADEFKAIALEETPNTRSAELRPPRSMDCCC